MVISRVLSRVAVAIIHITRLITILMRGFPKTRGP